MGTATYTWAIHHDDGRILYQSATRYTNVEDIPRFAVVETVTPDVVHLQSVHHERLRAEAALSHQRRRGFTRGALSIRPIIATVHFPA